MKNFKLVYFGPIGRPPIFQNGPQYRDQNNYDGYFSNLIDPLSVWNLKKKLLEIFQIAQFLADLQTPYFSIRPAIWGPKYL